MDAEHLKECFPGREVEFTSVSGRGSHSSTIQLNLSRLLSLTPYRVSHPKCSG